MANCSIPGCAGLVEARGWCRKHYGRWYRWGNPLESDHRSLRPTGICTVESCDLSHYAKGLCRHHYDEHRRPSSRHHHARQRHPRGAVYTCDHCGVTFQAQTRRRSSAAHIFCSRSCKGNYRVASGVGAQDQLRSYYKRRYGLTMEQAAEMRAAGCAICGKTDASGRWGKLHIDHDHATGSVRGILCNDCNQGLGRFKDNPSLLSAAVSYLTWDAGAV